MFGGYSLYWLGVIFAMAYSGRIYFKVDERTKSDYLAKGLGSFRPNERQALKS